MLTRRRIVDLPFVRCTKEDELMVPLGNCKECPYHTGIRRRRVYCQNEAESVRDLAKDTVEAVR